MRNGKICFLAAVLLCCAGCFGLAKKTRSVLATPTGATIDQKGAVETPAHIETKTSRAEFVIPKDSVFWFDPDARQFFLKFSRDVPASATGTEEHATAAKPVAPPSPADEAKAETLAKFYWVALALGLLAAFMFYEAHVKAGVVAGAGAVLVPALAKWFSNDAAQYVTLAVVCIAGALFVAWHLLKGRLQVGALPAPST